MAEKSTSLLTAWSLGILLVRCIPFAEAAAIQAQATAQATAASLPTAEVFAPGIISGSANDGSPTFSPDGNTLFFTRSATRWSIILESHRVSGQWSEPKVAPFSGEWPDTSPAFSPDGSFVVFVSVRPLAPAAAQPAQTKSDAPAMASHIWRVNRQGSDWSAPAELPATVNAFQAIFRPSVAADGTIYFTAAQKGKNLSLFRARLKDGTYLNAEPLTFSDGSVKDVDPEIAPDQSFLVFTSVGRRPDEPVHDHLFIVHNTGGAWGQITAIRYADDDAKGSSEDNDPRLSPDQRTLYFSSDRAATVHFPRAHNQAIQDYERLRTWDNSNSNIWTIPLAL
jgi:Tol biopolymer transport system component